MTSFRGTESAKRAAASFGPEKDGTAVSQKLSERANMNAEQKKELRRQDAREAMAEYTAEEAAARRKTARLRTLRLAREAEAAPVTKLR
jgi:hypothetical protein